MIKAISNSLGVSIIVLSSTLHYPIVYTTPRVCKVSVPVYVALNQSGSGHYSALSFQQEKTVTTSPLAISGPSTEEALPPDEDLHVKCTCGHSEKLGIKQRCIPIKKKYTSIVRCSCLAANKSCSVSCIIM